MLRFSVLSWLVLAAYAVAGCSAIARAEDAPAKEKSKARARAALALASAELVPPAVVTDPPVIAARAAAKAALSAKACGPSCPCGSCDCETCECCRAEKVKPMPPATPPEAEVGKRERMNYGDLVKAVEKLKPGESLAVYAGQDAPASATGRVVVLGGEMPGEEQRIGVWKCWNENGEPKMASMQPAKGGVRVVVDGRYLDRYPDGSLYWCVACNQGRK